MPLERKTVLAVRAKLELLVEFCCAEVELLRFAICALYMLGKWQEASLLLNRMIDSDTDLDLKWETTKFASRLSGILRHKVMIRAITTCGREFIEAKRWRDALEASLMLNDGVMLRRLLEAIEKSDDRNTFYAAYGRAEFRKLAFRVEPAEKDPEQVRNRSQAVQDFERKLALIDLYVRTAAREKSLAFVNQAIEQGRLDWACLVLERLEDYELLARHGELAFEKGDMRTAIRAFGLVLGFVDLYATDEYRD